MTFWDGTRWVPEATTPPPATPASTRRLRLPRRLPFLAVALGALLMIPTLGAGVPSTLGDTDLAASGPTVTLTGAAAPGVLVTIDGRGFRARTTYQVRWDSASHPLRLVWTDGAGRFHGHLRIPTTATDGRHYATFSLVAKAAAARVQAGTLQMSALVRTPSAVHLAVVVSRRRQPSPTPTPTPTPAGPTISAVTASSIDQTGATVSWTLSKPATGQVEFGTTTAYGRTTTAELSFSYSAHVQRLLALTPATVYHFRVRSQDASGHLAISGDRTFTTLGTAAPAPSPDPTASPTPTPAPSPTDTPVPSPTDTPVPSPTDTPVPTPIPTPAPTPVPTPTPTPTATPTPTPTATPTPTPTATPNPGGLTGYYGTLAADTKSNVQDHGKVAHRFVSPVTGLITSIRIQERGGPVYSGGTGGTYRFGIQADNGAGRPTGTYIGTTGSYVPGNSGVWDRFDAVAVSASVTAGQVLYAVFENIDANPSANYFSVNEIYTYTHMTPRQPRFSDADFQVLSYDSGVWTNHTETADMDVSYANGAHAGQSFIGMIGINGMSVYAATISGSSQVRETLSPTGTRVFTQASVRVRRTSGSDPLVLSLVNASGGVTVLGSVPASAVPQSAAGGDNGGSAWVTVTFPATSFSGGSLLLTTASTSAYTAAPIRDGADSGFDASLGFPDGAFQVTGNAGSTWAAAYASAPLDLQFYFR